MFNSLPKLRWCLKRTKNAIVVNVWLENNTFKIGKTIIFLHNSLLLVKLKEIGTTIILRIKHLTDDKIHFIYLG